MTGTKEEQVEPSPTSPDATSTVPPPEPTFEGGGSQDATPDQGAQTIYEPSSAPLGSSAELATPAAASWPDRDNANPEPRRSSLVPAVLALLVLLLGGAVAYLFSVMPDRGRMTALDSALGDLRKDVASLAARPQADTGGLTGRIDAVEADIKGVKSAVATLQSRLDALPAPAASASDDGVKTQVDGLKAQADGLKTQIDGLKAQSDELASKIAAATQAGAQTQQQSAALADKIGSADSEIATLKTGVDGLDKRLAPIEAERAAAKSPDRVTEARQNGSAAETRAAPLAVTAQAVLRAVDAGQPFAPDLAVLKTLGADPAALEKLKDVAETGAPTTKDLRAALAALRDQMATEAAPAPTGSYMDRLMAGAATLVHVRPLGSVVGDSPAAVLARMDDDLARDDLAAALAEWQKLPDGSRTAGKNLAERIRLRQSAQSAARTIGGDAIKAMAAAQQ